MPRAGKNMIAGKMRAILTHGPGYEPIDDARRITNFSTGTLGTYLGEYLAERGFEVTAMRGELATTPKARPPVETIAFSTNEDLLKKLKAIPNPDSVDLVLHLAALCDFGVSKVMNDKGEELNHSKIPTRDGGIMLQLTPSIKVLPQLKNIFTGARIIGWKYELNGDHASAVEAGLRQVKSILSDGCVVNGRAYGDGFGFVDGAGHCQHLADSEALAEWLVRKSLDPQYTPHK